MIHLSSFTAVRYRGIDGLSVPKLTRANLFTGLNGIGKTALLEAIWLFTGRYNPGLLWNANVQRSARPLVDPLSRLTHDKLELRGMENGEDRCLSYVFEKINGSVDRAPAAHPLREDIANLPPVVGLIRAYLDGKPLEEGSRGLHVTPFGAVLHQSGEMASERPSCVIENTRLHNEVPLEYLQRYSDLVREGQKAELVGAVNMVVEGIEDLEILTEDSGGTYLSVVMKHGKPQSIHDLGGGAVRLARLLLGFSASRNGIFLSDEMENGIHYRAQRSIWDRAREWMTQWNVQFVATTHSGELVNAAIEAFAEKAADDLSIHQIFRNDRTGQLEIATFTGESLAGARDLNLEVR